MKLVFVHGWSVTDTETYGDLPEALVARSGVPIDVQHIHLGRYISFHDEVSMDDVTRAFNAALVDTLGDGAGNIAPFSCVTHSTGGPVVREWIRRFYWHLGAPIVPLQHLVMLAPANHGSSLAALGKKRVGRIKAWFQGVEPGQRILDWLCLGSEGQWRLNEEALLHAAGAEGFYPFVLTGQAIDHKFYDFLNSYLVEKGSDGVIRVAGANMNCGFLQLQQTDHALSDDPLVYSLVPEGGLRRPAPIPLGVVPDASHSGADIGIMNSVRVANAGEKPVVDEILKCFDVQSPGDYQQRLQGLTQLTAASQQGGARYLMVVFQVRDDRGETIRDYDLLLLGEGYAPERLPKGFFVDRQFNALSGRLVYYVNADLMREMPALGFRVEARPSEGFSHYAMAEFRSDGLNVADILKANETLYVDIVLRRRVSKNVFEFGPVSEKPFSFKKLKPSTDLLP